MINIYLAKLLFYFLNLISILFDYIYVFIKVYRLLCFIKITFDQLPYFNPYRWPLSFIRIMTKPYLSFWAKFLPRVRLGYQSYEVSSIVGLEFLASLTRMAFRLRLILNIKIAELAKVIA